MIYGRPNSGLQMAAAARKLSDLVVGLPFVGGWWENLDVL